MAELLRREIVLPETKPETEWLRGRAVQKLSPKRKHGELQIWLGARLAAWAAGKGRVASEWRFRVAPRGDVIRPLVPDIAYLSYERMRGETAEAWDTPLIAPDVAIEVRSPSDRSEDLADKIDTLLRAGALAVVVIDADKRVAATHDASGVRTFAGDDVLEHPALPGFGVRLSEMFDVLELGERA